MQLIEQSVLQSYHLLGKDWTPLSPDRCWWRSYPLLLIISDKRYNCLLTNRASHEMKYPLVGSGASYADDLVRSRHCKHESRLWSAICWDLACLLMMCCFEKDRRLVWTNELHKYNKHNILHIYDHVLHICDKDDHICEVYFVYHICEVHLFDLWTTYVIGNGL